MAALSHSSKLFLFLIFAAAAFGQVSGSPGVTGGTGGATAGSCTNQLVISISNSAAPTCQTVTSAFVDTTVCSNASCTQTAALASGLTGSPAVGVSAISNTGGYTQGGKLLFNGTSPTISSGFGTSPTVPNKNGPASFTINVGTGGVATAGVIGVPAATTGWVCDVSNLTAKLGHRADNTVQTASTTNTISVENQTVSTGAAVAWTASDILQIKCNGF